MSTLEFFRDHANASPSGRGFAPRIASQQLVRAEVRQRLLRHHVDEPAARLPVLCCVSPSSTFTPASSSATQQRRRRPVADHTRPSPGRCCSTSSTSRSTTQPVPRLATHAPRHGNPRSGFGPPPQIDVRRSGDTSNANTNGVLSFDPWSSSSSHASIGITVSSRPSVAGQSPTPISSTAAVRVAIDAISNAICSGSIRTPNAGFACAHNLSVGQASPPTSRPGAQHQIRRPLEIRQPRLPGNPALPDPRPHQPVLVDLLVNRRARVNDHAAHTAQPTPDSVGIIAPTTAYGNTIASFQHQTNPRRTRGCRPSSAP